ncbi:hypothetical protein JOL79_16590 [Microbispora sp. RL4-1S]|uniref:Uncharacterized protein n=1 Tax=Microbispora oryzae TaxID=2806554 RepID=A0A941AJV8_9ACTN|nr:hypothetical protein [Microbispora oryzae]MBP2705432.1 hypothetical protein [Microbispora oryzae]
MRPSTSRCPKCCPDTSRCSVQCPGRQDRRDEPLIGELADRLFEVLADEETRRISLPVIRNDYRAIETYRHRPRPRRTRSALIRSPAMLRTKHADLPSRKHGNPPA